VKLAGSLVAQIAAVFAAYPEPEADARMHPAARLQSTLHGSRSTNSCRMATTWSC
jgi:hypothetical protein